MQNIPNDLYRAEKYMTLMSIYSSFDLTSKGFSVLEISQKVGCEEEEILEDLSYRTTFKGFKLPLDKSPIIVYNNVSKNKEKFLEVFKHEQAEEIYNFLIDFENFRKELDDLDNAITRLRGHG